MSQRLFVGNLPYGVTSEDLKQEFNAYGEVKNVEIKTKENLVDPDNPNVFAFVTIDISRQMITQCVNEFKQQEYRGRYLNVSLAKENFLDRLKREREESFSKPENTSKYLKIESDKSDKKIETLPEIPSSESESELSGLNESLIINEDEDFFIAKKKASYSLQNGKVRIEQVKNEPIHIIKKKSKDVKEFDEKAKISDLKRKESLNKMKNQYTQQKLAIQKALASVDTNKFKKVVFSDDDGNEKSGSINIEDTKKKLTLFNEEDDDDDLKNYGKDFELKSQYEGKSGEKLLKLQAKFKSDARFKMDEKFLENDDNYISMAKNNNSDEENVNHDISDERKWQLGIIEKVIGRKLETLKEPHQKKLHKTMLRYDPTKQEDQKFIRNIEKIAEIINEEKNESSIAMDVNEDQQVEEIEVSKEQFYTVNENLTKSLKQKTDGFSLLSLFGHSNDTENNVNNRNSIEKNTKPLLISKLNNHLDNPFKFDSSDSETEDIDLTMTENKSDKMETNSDEKNKTSFVVSKGGKTTKTGVWNENFFIFERDSRLKDGIEFFKKIKKTNEDVQENYDSVRDKLRLIIKKKIVKCKKNNMKEKKSRKGKFRKK